jgi:trans-2,3-dihydro-3-hydroxyanthranilate isomerase
MTAYDFETWDVFSTRRFSGNQLAVIADARGLSDDQMQAITREFNLAETSFVLPPETPGNTARVRIFTPGYEMPYAGHPTVGTAISIAAARKLSGVLKLELKAGLFPVTVDMDGPQPTAQFQNPNKPDEAGPAPRADIIEAALSLAPGAVDREAHRPRHIDAGVGFIFARASLDAVKSAKVDSSAWSKLGIKDPVGVLLYAEGGEAADAAYHVRMFAPDAGVFEDAATGSAAAALPGQIARSQKLADGVHKWLIEQGHEMGRPSRIRVEAETRSGAVQTVRVGGPAVPVMRGKIEV